MKKLKTFHKIGIMFTLGILLTACPKEWYKKLYIDIESKDYCLFEQDSYWVYQDSITFEKDSILIEKPIDYEFRFYNGGGDGGHDGETYSIFISSYSQNNKLSFNLILSRVSFDVDCLFIEDTISFVDSYNNSFYHNGQVGSYYWETPLLILLEKKKEYMINGVTYSDIKIFKKDIPEKSIYYFAKHIGLIRVEVYEDDCLISVKNLIKYNVKPYDQ